MRRVQLDGLRFVLFCCIFFVHYTSFDFDYLGYALPVFFVMSGFLITHVLLDAESKESKLGIRLKVFYIRRILRICPSYFLFVAVIIALGWVTFPFYYITYLVNFLVFDLSMGINADPSTLEILEKWPRESFHLWSLSVEEQFYILFPLALFLVPVRHRVAMLFTILLVSIASRILFKMYFPISSYGPMFYGALLPIIAEYFVWGCLFAWWDSRGTLSKVPTSLAFYVSGFAILALIAVERLRGEGGFTQFLVTNYQTPIAFAMGVFIWSLWTLKPTHPAVRFFSWRPLVYFGGMTYTLYLVHMAAGQAFRAMKIDLPFSRQVDVFIGAFVVTLLMGMVVWHLWEKPLYGLRRYFPVGKPTSDPVVTSTGQPLKTPSVS